MSEALQLAAMLEWTDPAAAAELRRLDAENAALLAANRDCLLHFNTLKADYDEVVKALREMLDLWAEDPAYGHDTAYKAQAALKKMEGKV